jgi:hypothetical protein
MSKQMPKFANRVKIVGRRIDLLKTDVAATFARIRREQAAAMKKESAAEQERLAKVRRIKC